MKPQVALVTTIIGVGVAADQLTKWQVFSLVSRDATGTLSIIPGVLQFAARRHNGAAFGLLAGQNGLLIAISVLALGAVGVVAFFSVDKVQVYGLGLIGAGALGNLVDRVFLGHVRDFIDVRFWPTFNVADSLITVGAVLLVWQALFRRPPRKKSSFETLTSSE